MEIIREKINRFSISVYIPGFVLKTVVGEIAESLTCSANVSANKIMNTGFRFRFEKAENAISDLF